mgnify:CR=1 FL=1
MIYCVVWNTTYFINMKSTFHIHINTSTCCVASGNVLSGCLGNTPLPVCLWFSGKWDPERFKWLLFIKYGNYHGFMLYYRYLKYFKLVLYSMSSTKGLSVQNSMHCSQLWRKPTKWQYWKAMQRKKKSCLIIPRKITSDSLETNLESNVKTQNGP